MRGELVRGVEHEAEVKEEFVAGIAWRRQADRVAEDAIRVCDDGD